MEGGTFLFAKYGHSRVVTNHICNNYVCFSGDWKIFNGNEIGALIGWWQFKIHTECLAPGLSRKDLYFIASTVSSKMLQSIAKEEGLSFEVYQIYLLY